MQISTEVNTEGTELTMKLMLVGKSAAVTEEQIVLYAQVEDPEKPGVYESWTCAVLLE